MYVYCIIQNSLHLTYAVKTAKLSGGVGGGDSDGDGAGCCRPHDRAGAVYDNEYYSLATLPPPPPRQRRVSCLSTLQSLEELEAYSSHRRTVDNILGELCWWWGGGVVVGGYWGPPSEKIWI